MAIKTIAPAEVERWCLDNERGIWPEVRPAGKPVAPQETVRVWRRERQPQPLAAPRPKSGKPWYQRQPRAWFKPAFAALLFVRERRQVFGFIALFGLIFALAWWATTWLLP